MATPVEVPKLGNTVEECLVAKWRKRKGEAVSAGEVVAEIETDKATFELQAPVSGTLLETFFDEGALVPVFTNLFVIGEPGEDAGAFRPQGLAAGTPAGAAPGTSPEARAPRTPESASAATSGQDAPIPEVAGAGQANAPSGAFSPRARRFAEERDFHPPPITGSGPGGRVLEEDVRRAWYSSPRVSGAAARRLEEGAEIRSEGSGIGGTVLSADLGPPATRVSGIRERIARRMRESLASTAQYTLHSWADASGLLALRARVKAARAASPDQPDININDLVIYCAVKALLHMPEVNAEFVDGKVYQHSEVHIGFACDTPRGLMVPVIRDAHKLTIAELASRARELAAAAVQGTIAVDSLAGATFTLSNLGGLGIESFTPLLNPPQVAILGVGAIHLKPVRRQGKVEYVDALALSLTCDHQIIDGAPGARFLQVVREKIENVEKLCTI